MTITRAPPTGLSLCSQTLYERAGRVYVGAKEDPARERCRRSAVARACSDVVGFVVRGTVREAGAQPLEWDRGRMGPAERALSRSQAPMEWAWARCLCVVA